MTNSSRNQIMAMFAAILCSLITIGMSVGPAVEPLAAIVA